MAKQMPTHTFTETAGVSRCSTWATPPYIPPTCRSVRLTVRAHAHTSQPTPRRGPGTRSNPSRPVNPVAMVKRPNSACTTGLIAQLRRMIHNTANPTCAPSVVVAINSPEPTIDAASTMPGPIRPSAASVDDGGRSIADGERMYGSPGVCATVVVAIGAGGEVWPTAGPYYIRVQNAHGLGRARLTTSRAVCSGTAVLLAAGSHSGLTGGQNSDRQTDPC